MAYKPKFFSLKEFGCPCGKCDREHPKMNGRLLFTMDLIREYYGPTIITSGVRCKEHNYAVGGVSYSQHLLGKAADFYLLDELINLRDVYDEICYGRFGKVSCGFYQKRHFIHVDVRKEPAFWATYV